MEARDIQLLGLWEGKFIYFGYLADISFTSCLVFKDSCNYDLIDLSGGEIYCLLGALCMKIEEINRTVLRHPGILTSMYRRLRKYCYFKKVKFFSDIRKTTELSRKINTCKREILWFIEHGCTFSEVSDICTRSCLDMIDD